MMIEKINETVKFIKGVTSFMPSYGIILGTGLGHLSEEIDKVKEINYSDIPNFPVSTVKSHQGKLIFGYLNNIPIVAMAGRFHYYEGYSMQKLTFPVRVLKYLGIKTLIISNVSGGTNPNFKAGDIIFVKDHINMMLINPLIGSNDENIGPRFPDMLNIYNRKWNKKGLEIANINNIRAFEGVYLSLTGPNLETPAEYEMVHTLGGDMVGMSTVPEVIVARHMDLPVFVMSIIANQSYPIDAIKETSVEDVIKMGNEVEPKMSLIVKEMLYYFENI